MEPVQTTIFLFASMQITEYEDNLLILQLKVDLLKDKACLISN